MHKRVFLIFLFFLLGSCSTKQIDYGTLNIEIDKTTLLKHFLYLSSDELEGRKVSTEGSVKAQNYIVEHLERHNILPFKQQYLHDYPFKKGQLEQGHNIASWLKGIGDTNDYIVLTAHFDHLGIKNGMIYNGADDNASGVSALLALSSYLSSHPLKHNVMFLFTDGEESQLSGSKHFLKSNQDFHQNILLNINLDMLAGARSSKQLFYVHRNLLEILSEENIKRFENKHHLTEVKVSKKFNRAKYPLNEKINWLKASDHASFHRYGIPFIYYGVGTHKNYHSVKDDFENTNHELLYHSVNVVLQQLKFIDQNIN